MKKKIKIKKGDNVLVISGKNVGRQGKIERIFSNLNKAVVTGVNISKHHLKPSRKNPHGGIIDMPSPIDISNLMIVCPRCGKPTRVGAKIIGNSTKVKKIRICRKCKESLDQNA